MELPCRLRSRPRRTGRSRRARPTSASRRRGLGWRRLRWRSAVHGRPDHVQGRGPTVTHGG
ncbi:hypothetical protein XA26_60640 [Mycolicibacterium fortuitum]|uniref:Uncharacterized protein n=1 Tax=Mycolicibacterium fortuitum TaxID=1766 RepID=A0A0N9Y9E6_MYCFO|nr:hypothetical protein G155_00278 [Mycobacterium sp. VKM Ac-1817D]ALI29845.1 hypothetical protein XA26_60640 [Mycolicibacterium fortuitum]